MLAHIFTDTADDTTDERSNEATSNEVTSNVSLDMIFDVLRNERRRHALRHLATRDEEVRFGDLVDHVAAKEHDVEIGSVDSSARKAVYTSLYQSHLPKLADMGVISYDRQSGPVSAGPHLDEVLECLDAVLAARGEKVESDVESGPKRGLQSLRHAINV